MRLRPGSRLARCVPSKGGRQGPHTQGTTGRALPRIAGRHRGARQGINADPSTGGDLLHRGADPLCFSEAGPRVCVVKASRASTRERSRGPQEGSPRPGRPVQTRSPQRVIHTHSIRLSRGSAGGMQACGIFRRAWCERNQPRAGLATRVRAGSTHACTQPRGPCPSPSKRTAHARRQRRTDQRRRPGPDDTLLHAMSPAGIRRRVSPARRGAAGRTEPTPGSAQSADPVRGQAAGSSGRALWMVPTARRARITRTRPR